MAALAAATGLLAIAPSPAAAAWEFVSQWGSSGTGDGQFQQPRGIALAPSGRVYVADSLNDRVQFFGLDGTFIGKWGGTGAADGQFQSAYGTALLPGGDIVAADRNNHRIQRFTPDGAFVAKFGSFGSGAGQLNAPSAIATDAAGNAFVADYSNRRVVKFDVNGAFVTAFGTAGSGDGQFNLPDGIATDAGGNVYVIDGTNRVQKFTNDGVFVLRWGSGGTAPGQFNRPGQLAATSGGDVYVSDVFAHRIVHFRETTGAALPPPKVGKTVNVRVVRGVVRVKRRGSRRFVRLRNPRQIPVGSTLDTLRGTVELTSAADSAGATQTGQFYKGRFVVAQRRARTPVTDLKLTGGNFRRCPRSARAAAKAPKRRLWGKATGRFRSVGRSAAATVRGTTWMTEDRCSGTLVRVTEGSVTVRDLIRRRSVVINAPGFYFSPSH